MKILFRLIAVLLLITACHKFETPESFVDRNYIMHKAPEGARITIGFEGQSQRFFGESGVNRYFGIYTIHDDKLSFSPAGSTMMSGNPELMKVEYDYLQALGKVTHFKMEGHKLYLYTSDNQELEFTEMSTLDNVTVPVTNRYLKKAVEQRKEQ